MLYSFLLYSKVIQLYIYIHFFIFFPLWFLKNIYVFIWLHRALVAACGIFRCGTQALHCGTWALEHAGSVVAVCGLSRCDSQALECTGSVVAAHRLSCPTACEILLPQPGIEPMSPALEGGFLTTGPTGNSLHYGLSQDVEQCSLGCTIGSCCLCILYIIVCICLPQTPTLSLPQPPSRLQPQVCSLSL